MTLRCIIIDDEPLAVELLAGYVRRTPFLTLAGTFSSAIEAVRDIKEAQADILFLDIQMPTLGGIELARIVPPTTKIVFTTAFSQYAIDGYKVNAAGYLLKPISYDDFLATVAKLHDDMTNERPAGRLLQQPAGQRFIFVRSEYKLVQIRLDDILYIEGRKDYLRINLDGGTPAVDTLMNMRRMEEFLPAPEFLRIHRSYIVHMPKVSLIDSGHVTLGDTMLPVSESYKDSLTKSISSYIVN